MDAKEILTINQLAEKLKKSHEGIKQMNIFEKDKPTLLERLGGTKITTCCQKGMDQPVYLDEEGRWHICPDGDRYGDVENVTFCPYCGCFLE